MEEQDAQSGNRTLILRRIRKLVKPALVLAVFYAGLTLVYANSVYPGVTVNGVRVAGMNREQAIAEVAKRAQEFNSEVIPMNYGATTIRISPSEIGAKYDVEKAVDYALDYARAGKFVTVLKQQALLLMGKRANFTAYNYNDAKLAPYLQQIDTEVNEPVANATFNVVGTSITITEGQPGKRLNRGSLLLQLNDQLAKTSNAPLEVAVSSVLPVVDKASLEPVKSQAELYISAPVQLDLNGKNITIAPTEIVGWLEASRPSPKRFAETKNITDFITVTPPAFLRLNKDKLGAYVAGLAQQVDRPAQNAALTITDNRATVFKPSRTGYALDQEQTKVKIEAALNQTGERKVTAVVATIKPEISEGSLNDLGIVELLSEGVSYFTGSIPDRVTNIRLGAALYNGLLIKPGETFSFNKYFINVDAEHGWTYGLSIIGNKIEPIFGGGICQVSSTIYRAALLAALPINARTNHAYAVSYYAAPYGVPGVDATVYNPGVDFKFTNDTGAHILIQTIIQGTTLKFQFYGTKTKVGRIRGPYFLEGSVDYTKPSKTIFYRDVLDLSGKVLETHSVTTSYKSSLDFKQVTTP